MTAFLFIPPTTGVDPGTRRVDLAGIARLFAEVDTEAPVPQHGRSRVTRIAVLLLILFGAIGDTVLVARHETLAACLATGASPKTSAARS